MPKRPDVEELAERFTFLDALRESGKTNMYGASPYVAREFGLKREASNRTVQAWMRTFSDDKTPEQRAAEWFNLPPNSK